MLEGEHTNVRMAEWGEKRLILVIIKVKDRMVLLWDLFQPLWCMTLSFRFTSQEPVCIKDFSVTWEVGWRDGEGWPHSRSAESKPRFQLFSPGWFRQDVHWRKSLWNVMFLACCWEQVSRKFIHVSNIGRMGSYEENMWALWFLLTT